MRVFLGVKTQKLISRVFVHPVNQSAAVRWGPPQTRLSCSSSPDLEKPPHSMLRHLTSKIKSTGPISVAEYMREVLTNPVTGYYVRNNMLGPDGDFITSPEISQIFGELLGVWIISEWMGAGRPKQLQLVELGPGKGSLASDILRVFSQLQSVLGEASVSLHLVEVSPTLSQLQAQNLTGNTSQEADSEDEPVYRRGKTTAGLPVCWYRRLDDVPTGFSVFVAHEFFDALPIHKFQRTEKGWREVMVDIDPEKPDHLRFVVTPSPTLASSTLVQADERRDHVEVCAEGGVIIQQLVRRITEDGGAALIADYGHDGTKTDTFRAFKGHQLHDVLASPGTADLTADVDFSYLRRMAGGGVACMGPVTQRTFLKNMGIDTRLQVLLRNCTDPNTRKQLISSYDMLTNRAKMGERFLFFSVLHQSRLKKKIPAQLPVAGFTELSFS
uniref:Protein arginine methyltransferase NDUFAF7 n=1 Tax=Anabas testudineus TaxID=64144 RepID=A0A7N6AEP3_ANATE